jgi:CRP-like cAMP-binding protein
MNPRELKDVATDHFRKGRFAKAADAYLALSKAEPQEPQHFIKLGDSYRRDGQREKAVEAYRGAVNLYANRGVVIKAIAACKLILEIDATRKDAQEDLARLCAKRYVRRGDLEPPSVPGQPAHREAPPAARVEPATRSQSVRARAPSQEKPWLREHVHIPTPHEAAPPQAGAPPQAATNFADDIVSDADFVEDAPSLPAVQRPPRDLGLEAAVAAAQDMDEAVLEELVDEPSIASVVITPETTGEQQVMNDVATVAKRPATAMAHILADATRRGESGPVSVPSVAPPPPPPTPSLPAPLPPGPPSPPEVTGIPVRLADVDQAAVPLFSELPREAFVDLLEQLTFRRVNAGEVILHEGDDGKSIFVLASGRAEVVLGLATDHPLRLAILEDGAFFGEMALLNGSTRVASVLTLEDSDILEISENVLRQLTARHPSVGVSLKKFYRQRLLQNVMAISPLFKAFDRDNRRQLVEKFKLRELKSNEVVIKEGTPTDGLYVVMHGTALVQKTDPKTGRVVPLAVLKEGDVFGEMSLLTHKPAGASVITKRRTLILRLPKPIFDELKYTHPAVLEVVSELSDQRTKVNEKILAGEVDAPREALAFL